MLNLKRITAAALAAFALSAQAQSIPPDAAKPARPPTPDSPPSATVALPAVGVTGRSSGAAASDTALDSTSATRTDTPLIEVSQSVQVLTRQRIEEQDARTLADALRNVSGVIPSEPAENTIVGNLVRGFPADIYVDGLPTIGMNATNSPASLVGIDRIEVLKGPASTLYGGGPGAPLGGLIDIETERPNAKPGGYVAMRTGSDGTLNPYFDMTGALARSIDARLAGEYAHDGNAIDHVKGERWALKPSVLFKLAPRTRLLVQGQFDHRSQREYSGLPAAQALAGQLDRYAFPGATTGQPRTAFDSQMATVRLEHAFNDRLRLTVSGRYYNSRTPEYGSFVEPDRYPPAPATPTTYPILGFGMLTRTRNATLDANLAADVDALGGQHLLLAGVSYDHTDFSSDMGLTNAPIGMLDLARPAYQVAFGTPVPLSMTMTDHDRTLTAYVQDQATYGRLHVTGSLRYTQLRFHEVELGTDATYHHVSPRIGATVDLAPGVAAYAAYATAFRAPAGFVGLAAPKPETSRNVEAGVKLALKHLGLSGTLAVFDQTRENVATPDPGHPLFQVQSGRQRARGVETDLTWEPVPALSLFVNYAYTRATVTEDNAIPVGDTLARVPKHSGRVAFRYRVTGGPAHGLSFGAGMTAFGARELTLPNSVSVPGYALFDAQAEYRLGRYTVGLSMLNLTNRHVYAPYQYFSYPVVMPVQPRTVYVTLKALI
ncbi:TonB-dependent siderophore receptor [Burkholderia sp. 22PA0106]|uniref:TonB-dependent siderophore receptor n=1 Tax=Burkholderia sp. 22PA0106 TaxID=3237371 RepID=UPI0039C07EB1